MNFPKSQNWFLCKQNTIYIYTYVQNIITAILYVSVILFQDFNLKIFILFTHLINIDQASTLYEAL